LAKKKSIKGEKKRAAWAKDGKGRECERPWPRLVLFLAALSATGKPNDVGKNKKKKTRALPNRQGFVLTKVNWWYARDKPTQRGCELFDQEEKIRGRAAEN